MGLPASGGKWQLYGRLKKHLASEDRRFLIVIDDVWEPEDVRLLLVDGPQSRVLITGRELQIPDQAGIQTERIKVPMMTEPECLALIEKQIGPLGQDRPQAIEFLNRIGCLPMTIALGAGLARDRGWQWLLESTKESIMPVLQRGRRPGRYDSLAVALALSYGRLSEVERIVFDLLGALTSGEVFTVKDIEALCPSPILQEIERCGMSISTLLHRLYERALLQRAGEGGYCLHAVTRDFVLRKPGR